MHSTLFEVKCLKLIFNLTSGLSNPVLNMRCQYIPIRGEDVYKQFCFESVDRPSDRPSDGSLNDGSLNDVLMEDVNMCKNCRLKPDSCLEVQSKRQRLDHPYYEFARALEHQNP